MTTFSTAFVGAGNMAYSIISGLLEAGADPASIRAADPSADRLAQLQALGVVALDTHNASTVADADVVVLAVKPQLMREVCESLAPAMHEDQLIISIAAGISADSLAKWLGNKPSIVRCMPNTPSLMRAGAAALFADAAVSAQQRAQAETIMSATGQVCWVDDEALLHAVTAVSGSGPAYFFLFMEAMMAEGQRMGLDPQTTRKLCAQTCVGAGQMVAAADVDAAELRRRVCSPGGTTERAVAAFQEGGLETLVKTAMQACYQRSEDMARELS